MSHFKKYWKPTDEESIIKLLEEKVSRLLSIPTLSINLHFQFRERYNQICCVNGSAAPSAQPSNSKNCSRFEGLLRDNLLTDSEAEEDEDSFANTSAKPWRAKFQRYLDTVEAIPDDIDIVAWWGVHTTSITCKFNLTNFNYF